ncbi:MAG: RNA-binding transcriptional accessory protein [Bacteroidales bacterium]|nr:RNA-binding transcriptional accessory protein [Bacteroidales bacterium]
MIKNIYVKAIARMLQVKDWQVENCAGLFEEGATIPFVSRYRKERTGGLDEVEVAEIRHWVDVFAEMEKRKATVLETIEQAGALTPELHSKIENTVDSRELEDLYLPYKPKRRTRATAAKEAGLEPLADKMYSVALTDPSVEARKYLNDKVTSVEDALAGARDIIAERLSETASVRDTLRQIFRTRRVVTKATKKATGAEAMKYRSYFDYSESLERIAPHRLLAILRAEEEGFLNIKIDVDPEKCGKKIYYDFCQERRYPAQPLAEHMHAAFDDSFKRLLEPSISNEVIKEAKEKADIESIRIFGENLRQLLLAPPVGQKRVLAIDPGFRTGCKVVCLDEQGNLLHNEAIFPHPPANEKVKAIQSVSAMVQKYGIEVIAIGNGTASRETEDFIKKVPLPKGVRVFTVSEDGASIYSASEIAREEFPDHDVTVRGAVSIGRRLMDPLAELVKIDPKSLGVGQYQHDVDQTLLKEKLDNTVESCVNSVGVNLNTASSYLLSYVSGIGPALADNIVEYRTQNGAYTSRKQLLKVKRLGDKAFEQCAGFLRIQDAENPLDNSAVHPEAYHIVDRMARDLKVSAKELVGNAELCAKINASDYVDGDFGLPTINDILNELRKPGRDPRESAQEFEFASDIKTIEDLKIGMELPGIVTNITAFGAFVDIGIKQNGLIHATQMGVKGMADPSKILKLHQQVKVTVISVDMDRLRIGLRLNK